MSTVESARDEAQRVLLSIWEDMLGIDVEPQDDFFLIGGDSLLVVELVLRAREEGLSLKGTDVFENPRLTDLAATAVSTPRPRQADAFPRAPREMSAEQVHRTYLSCWSENAPRCLVPLVAGDDREPLFLVHWGAGNVRFAGEIAGDWSAGRPVYGFEAVGYRGDVRPLVSVTEMAERFLAELCEVQPHGPYFLSGMCLGGLVALEMARRLRSAGEDVALLALINVSPMDPFLDRGWGLDEIFRYRLESVRDKFGLDGSADTPAALARMREWEWYDTDTEPADVYRLQMLWAALAFAQHHWEARPYEGRTVMFQDSRTSDAIDRNWRSILPDLTIHWIEEGVDRLATLVRSPLIADALSAELKSN